MKLPSRAELHQVPTLPEPKPEAMLEAWRQQAAISVATHCFLQREHHRTTSSPWEQASRLASVEARCLFE